MSPKPPLRDLALFFLKLGTTAFGGPAAHIAMMQQELVVRRQWVGESDFLDLLAAANLLPGPTSTELAIYIGYLLAGLPGLVIAGVCFILPAFMMVLAIAWAYVKYNHLPAVTGILYGVKPVVLAIVIQALYRLTLSSLSPNTIPKPRETVENGVAVENGVGHRFPDRTEIAKNGVRHRFSNLLLDNSLGNRLHLVLVSAGAIAMALLQVNALIVLCVSALMGSITRWTPRRTTMVSCVGPFGVSLKPFGGVTVATSFAVVTPVASLAVGASLSSLFFVFLKFSCVIFGSGYVLLAFLREDLVTHRHWLTEAKLLDAVAVGQVTPGPVFTTATFIGYLIAGPAGAVVATLGIFCPAFFFVALTGRLVAWLRSSAVMSGAIDGLRVGSVALMAVATWQLATAAVVDPLTSLIAAVALVVLLLFDLNSVWLVAAGAALGLMRTIGS